MIEVTQLWKTPYWNECVKAIEVQYPHGEPTWYEGQWEERHTNPRSPHHVPDAVRQAVEELYEARNPLGMTEDEAVEFWEKARARLPKGEYMPFGKERAAVRYLFRHLAEKQKNA